MPTEPEQLLKNYIRAVAKARARTQRQIETVFDSLGSYNESDLLVFTKRISPLLTAVHVETSAMAKASISKPGLIVAAPEFVEARQAFIPIWRDLARGVQWSDAVAAGRGLAGALATEQSTEASRDVMRQVAPSTPHRRVPFGATCNYCIALSTRRYHSFDTAEAASHKNCDCEIRPIEGGDPGALINRETYKAWKEAQKVADGEKPPRYFDAETLEPLTSAAG